MPQYEINIGDAGASLESLKPLSPKDYPVMSISVNQSVGPASSAQITFACPYDYKKTDFANDIYSKLEPGKMVEIKLGYEKPKTMFVGALGSIRVDFTQSGITAGITCYDAKMTLFYNTTWRSFQDKSTIQEVVEKVLEPCKKYGDVKVTGLKYDKAVEKGFEISWMQDYVNDYQYVMRLAALTNSSFYASGGTIYFAENIIENAPAEVMVGWGSGLMNFSIDIDISGQVGSVEVAYRNANREERYLVYSGKDIKGDGKLASDKGAIVSEKSYEMTEILVRNEEQAEITAKHKLMMMAMNYVTGRGSTIGIPDLMAGTGVFIAGVGEKLEGEYFLSQVNHQFDAGGYLTSFTCQRPKIQI